MKTIRTAVLLAAVVAFTGQPTHGGNATMISPPAPVSATPATAAPVPVVLETATFALG